MVYGEQRGAAVADFNEDGRMDLVVTQNGAATRLFENRGATKGLRLFLEGTPGNPKAVGSVIRLAFGEKLGPAREIRAGGGYWSQDSPVQVLSTPTPPTGLWVRWPGGKITTTELSPGLNQIQVGTDGKIMALP